MAVAGREKTADMEWPELVWYTEKDKENCLLVWDSSCGGNDSQMETYLLASDVGKVLKLLWIIIQVWNECNVVTIRLRLYTWELSNIWGTEGTSSVHSVYMVTDGLECRSVNEYWPSQVQTWKLLGWLTAFGCATMVPLEGLHCSPLGGIDAQYNKWYTNKESTLYGCLFSQTGMRIIKSGGWELKVTNSEVK